MDSIKREQIASGVYFNTIKNNRFKSTKLSVSCILPLNGKDASVNALLPDVLTRTSRDYPDFTRLSKRLSRLYGAGLSGYVTKMGDNQVLTFTIGGIDDKYAMNGECISADMSQLLCDILFRPKLEGKSFCTDEINQGKRQLKDLIDSEFNDKRTYANNRFSEIMCKGEPFGLSRLGTKDSVDGVTGKDLYNAWKNMLSKGWVEIFFIGESSSNGAKKIFSDNFAEHFRDPHKIVNAVESHSGKIKEENEYMELAQSKMIMGFRTDVANPSRDVMAMRVAVALLGGTSHSKLFNNVREKLSLCYYCSARYNWIKGIMQIECGVEKENIDKAKKAILNELKEMAEGNISDLEIESTKLSICNDFIALCDYDTGIAMWYLRQIMDGGFDSVEEACKKVNAVTKEQIVKMASRLYLDTIYVLESK